VQDYLAAGEREADVVGKEAQLPDLIHQEADP
jgi:hypothetical protein